MIAFIEGRVLFLGTGMMVVQTQSGVGYEIRVPETICLKSQSNQEIQLYIHTHVREDELTLYGFSSWEEKELFQMVIKTTGVGPKLVDRSTDRCGFSKQHCGLQPGFRDWSQNGSKTLPGPEGSVEKPGNEGFFLFTPNGK